MKYNWQYNEWPNFTYDLSALKEELAAFKAVHSAVVPAYSLIADSELESDCLVREAMHTGVIEGIVVDESVVMSSVCRMMGLKYKPGITHDERAEGIASLIMDVKRDWQKPLSRELLLFWHRDLLPSAPFAGHFRTHKEPMRVVKQDAYGEFEVRFEAPPSSRVESEITQFISAAESFSLECDVCAMAALKAAFFHLYFESVHPFEDGNGRIGRALISKFLAESFGDGIVIPVSPVIEKEKKQYYEVLNKASYTLDWTAWAKYFIPLLTRSLDDFVAGIDFILMKQAYLEKWENLLSERELKVIKRVFKYGAEGVGRGLSAAKYQRISGVSKATATRDLSAMSSMGAIKPKGGGRGTTYELRIDN